MMGVFIFFHAAGSPVAFNRAMVSLYVHLAASNHSRNISLCSRVGYIRIRFDCVFVPTESMQPATEGMDDGENILGEFPLGAVFLLTENQDAAVVLLGQPLDKLESEPGKPIPVGNHNRELISAV